MDSKLGKMPPQRRVVGDIAVQIVGRGLTLVAALPITVLLVRSLGDEAFGQWSTILAIVQIAGLLGELRLEQATVRLAARQEGAVADLLWSVRRARLMFALPASLLAMCMIGILSDSPRMLEAGLIVSGVIIIYAIGAGKAIFEIRTRNDIPVLLSALNTVAWGGAVIILGSAGATLPAYAIAYTGAVACMVGFQILAIRKLERPSSTSSGHWRSIIRTGGPVGIAFVVIMSYMKADQIMVYQIAGEADAGLYGAAYRLLDQGKVIPSAIMVTLFPQIAAAIGKQPVRASTLASRACEGIIGLTIPPVVVALVAGASVVQFLFGPDFAESSRALVPLMLALCVSALALVAINVTVAAGQRGRLIGVCVGGLILNIAGNAVLIPKVGFVGAAWMTLATEVMVAGLLVVGIYKIVVIRPSAVRIAKFSVAGLVMAGVLLAVMNWEIGVPAALTVATMGYIIAVLVVRALTVDEVRTAMRRDRGVKSGRLGE